MDAALGLLGMLVFIVATIGLAAAVTFAIVKISPTNRRRDKEPASDAGS